MQEYIEVTKRDGRKEPFNSEKIIHAIGEAFKSIDVVFSCEANDFAIEVAHAAEKEFKKSANVEDIQNFIERKLMASKRKDVAKAFILYRQKRTEERTKKLEVFKSMEEKLKALNVQNQNANIDEKSFGGRRGEAMDAFMKEYALNNCMSEKSKNRHLNNEIYIHDIGHYANGDHNCLSIPFDHLLRDGFTTRQGDVRPAKSISTAFQLIAVVSQIQSLQQFGGVSASHLDWTMVPYYRKSFHKHFCDGMKFIYNIPYNLLKPENISVEDECYHQYERAYNYAYEMTQKELKQACEGMLHNLNTLQSRSGNQLPFTSVNYGTCTLPEGQRVIEALLDAQYTGIGKFHRTSVFPCAIFKLKNGVNEHEGEPNYYLFKKALKCTARRLYPNYANVDWSGNKGYDPSDPRTEFSTMGRPSVWPM